MPEKQLRRLGRKSRLSGKIEGAWRYKNALERMRNWETFNGRHGGMPLNEYVRDIIDPISHRSGGDENVRLGAPLLSRASAMASGIDFLAMKISIVAIAGGTWRAFSLKSAWRKRDGDK